MADLGFQLKTHLYNMVTNNLAWEYMDQIEAWKLYIENVVDAAKGAADAHTTTLQQANAEIQEAREKAFATFMFILNMFALPAVYWFGAALKIKWGPKYTATTRTVMERKLVLINNRYFARFKMIPKNEFVAANPVADSVLGDVGKAVGGFLVDLTKKNLAPPAQPFKRPDTKLIQGSNEWQSFRTGLMTTLYEGQQFGQQQIRTIANSIENNAVSVGQALVDRLFREQPYLKTLKGLDGDNQRYLAGAAMINKQLNDSRKGWADQWFYYGNDAPELKPDIDVLMERQFWATWLLEEEPGVREERPQSGRARWELPPVTVMTGKTGFLGTKAVQDRLLRLGAPMYLPTPRPTSAADPDLVGAVSEIGEGYKGEGKMQAGVDHLMSWAKTNIPNLGPLDFGVPRSNLVSIEQYTGKFVGKYQH